MQSQAIDKANKPARSLRCVIAVVAAIGCFSWISWIFLIGPKLRYNDLVTKYPAGTRAETIIEDYKGKVALQVSGFVLPPGPTEDDEERGKRVHTFYFMRIPEANAEVDFNYYKQVTKVRKISELGLKVTRP